MLDLLSLSLDTSLSFLQGIPAWVRDEASLPLAVLGLAALVVVGAAFFLAIVAGVMGKEEEKWDRWIKLQKQEVDSL